MSSATGRRQTRLFHCMRAPIWADSPVSTISTVARAPTMSSDSAPISMRGPNLLVCHALRNGRAVVRVALMAIVVPHVSSRTSTTVVTITVHVVHAGAGWDAAHGAVDKTSASNTGTRACLSQSMICPASEQIDRLHF